VRQLVYISTVTPNVVADAAAILAVSRRNNARDRITGLLWFNGKRFLQALEGEEDTVERAYARIKADARHRAVVTLSDRAVESREFGPWSMASASDSGDAARRVSALVADAAPDVRATFEGFVEMPRAAA